MSVGTFVLIPKLQLDELIGSPLHALEYVQKTITFFFSLHWHQFVTGIIKHSNNDPIRLDTFGHESFETDVVHFMICHDVAKFMS